MHPGKTNHLIHSKSPYLLQHADNPVNWYPWSEEALSVAKKEDKPIFLSIGYATCHWCHVMAHESFEDQEVAEALNASFISIKVDREERPDIDQIYMAACQLLTGHGGWPLSIFMTPEGKPFFAGTYFPKTSRMGMPGFLEIVKVIGSGWQQDREKFLTGAEQITKNVQLAFQQEESDVLMGKDVLKKAYVQLARTFDPTWGGFGRAPKFPVPHHITFLWRWHKRTGEREALKMAGKTLEAMRRGGIFDHIGYGFHRYSVDEKWLIPHFEKMLYDQALLANAYTEGRLATGNIRWEKIAHEIFTYVLRDMTAPEGGFYSAEDADSEGKEGLFYSWTPAEVKKSLGDQTGDLFCRFYGIDDKGNFEEGRSIPYVRMSLEDFAKGEGVTYEEIDRLFEQARQDLFQVRKGRIHPLKDDKILTSWNGLMIAALAKASQAFGRTEYLVAAQNAASFILEHLRKDGRLLRRYRDGEAAYPAYLDDYAFLTWGLIELHQASFETSWLEKALAFCDEMNALFWDEQGGGLYFTGRENEALIVQSKDQQDGALPSGNSIALINYLRLGRMTGRTDLEHKGEDLLRLSAKQCEAHPTAHTQLLSAVDFMEGPTQELVVAVGTDGEKSQKMLEVVRSRFLPNMVMLLKPQGTQAQDLVRLCPFVEALMPTDGRSTAYLCQSHACQNPITEPDTLAASLP
jgi:hypothetical protein